MQIVAIIVQVLLALGFLMSGSMKVIGTKQSLEMRDHVHVAPWFWRLTGAIEVVGAIGMIVGIWFNALSVVAGLLLGATMIGAVYVHLSNKDQFGRVVPALVLLVLALVVVVIHWPTLAVIL